MKRIAIAAIGVALTAVPAEAASILEQISPTPTSYAYETDYGTAGPLDDGTYVFGPSVLDITAQIYRLTGTDGANGLSLGCAAGDYGGGVSGIVLLARGTCGFVEKAQLAQDAGALAILIADYDPMPTSLNMGGFNPAITIGAFRLSSELGTLLAEQTLTTPTTIRLALGSNLVSNLPAVPEPATWAMFIGGFGLIGGAMRRQRRIAVRFA